MKLLAEISWSEAHAAKGALVLLPVGSTEAHGPHLPLGTDAIISEALARRASVGLEARGYRCLIAPAVGYAVTEYAGEFTGTVSLSASTATALVAEICRSLIRQGFPRVVLVNSHLEPAHLETLRAAARSAGEGVLFPDCCSPRWARTLTEEFKRGACHAGSYETSLVLAARGDLVSPGRAALAPRPIDLARAMKKGVKTFKEAGADQAYFGDPAAATREEGESIFERLVAMILTEVGESWPAPDSRSPAGDPPRRA